jgi:hypothetical protein
LGVSTFGIVTRGEVGTVVDVGFVVLVATVVVVTLGNVVGTLGEVVVGTVVVTPGNVVAVVVVRPGQSGWVSLVWAHSSKNLARAAAASSAVCVAVAGTVTTIACGEPERVVWALPATSLTENVPTAAVRVDVTAPPPAVAVDVAVIVHTVPDVCAIDEIAEIPVNVKSVPAVVDSVVQSRSSEPVTVKVIIALDEVVADAAIVTLVGAVESTVTVPVEAVDRLSMASTAYTLYVPSTSPVAASDVSVLTAVIDTWFHCESTAPVMLALFVTVTVSFIKYAVPVLVLRTVADAAALIRAVVTVTVGVVPSSGIAAALAVDVLVVVSLKVAVTVNV